MGRVKVEVQRDILRLRFSHGGSRYSFSLGIPDNKTNRKLAEAKAQLIESDIAYERFDHTLESYRPESTKKPLEPKPTITTFRHLWQRYQLHRTPLVAKNTVVKQYQPIQNHLNRAPNFTLEEAYEMTQWASDNLTPDMAKRVTVQLNAASKWALELGLINTNSIERLVKRTGRANHRKTIDPFYPDEVEAILTAFRGRKHEPIIQFLFMTGCRTGEALGLRWSDVKPDYSSIYIQRSITGNIESDTKNHKARTFPCTPQLIQLLKGLGKPNSKPNDLVFQVGKGRQLHQTWADIVESLVEQGKVRRYRPQYNTRHTFITRALEAGIPITQVAEWAGNSPKIILERYAGILGTYLPPEI